MSSTDLFPQPGTVDPRSPDGAPSGRGADRARRQRGVSRSMVMESLGSAGAALAAVWVVFTVAGITAPFGMIVCWYLLYFTVYGVLCWRLYGPLIAKDRMATLAIWSGAGLAMFALAAVILYVFFKGIGAVVTDFPHFLTADMTKLGGAAKISDIGVGAAIVGTVEQVGIATIITVASRSSSQ